MKKLLLIAAALVIAGAVCAQTKSVVFNVENITCGKCVAKVTELMSSVDGVLKVTVEPTAKKEVTVEFDQEKTKPCKIVESLKDTKYKVVGVNGKAIGQKEEKHECSKEAAEKKHECSKETAEKKHECNKEAAEKKHECSKEAAEKKHECNKEAAEKKHECKKEAAEKKHECNKEATEKKHECNKEKTAENK